MLIFSSVTSVVLSIPKLENCSIAEYYCPPTYECRLRELRCTPNDNCTYPNNDDMCFSKGVGEAAYYAVIVGYVPYLQICSTTVASHQFVQYRGYTYEFGPRGVDVLDIADPSYKYVSGRNVNRFRIVGFSSCTYEEVAIFTRFWNNQSYHLLFNNCIAFAKSMVRFLMSDKCQGRKKNRLRSFLGRILNKNGDDISEMRVADHASPPTTLTSFQASAGTFYFILYLII